MSAQYSRAYGNPCGIGCAAQSQLRNQYNPNCGRSACGQTLCQNGGVTQRENFVLGVGNSDMPPTTDCTPNDPYDYTNHLHTNQGGNRVNLGATSGIPFCNIIDATVNEAQLPFAAIGWSALANAYSYIPSTNNRVYDTETLTHRGRKFADYNLQYAKHGPGRQKPDVLFRACS